MAARSAAVDLYVVRKVATERYGVVIRDITHLDMARPNKAYRSFRIVGAYQGYAFGACLGHVVFDGKTGETHELSVSASDGGSIITKLLTSEVALCTGKPVDMPTLVGTELSSSSEPLMIGARFEYHEHYMDLVIHYKPLLAGVGHETPHGLEVYPSYSFSATEAFFVGHENANPHKKHKITLHTKSEFVSDYAMLNVDAYANIVTESGQVCINQAGYANFRLLELVAKRGQWFNQPLIVPNSSVRKYKGMLSIACVGTSLKSKPEGSRVASIARVRGSADKAQRLINDYIQINRQFYEQHPPLTESVRQVTVFRYDGRKGRIPGSMFDIFKIPPSYEEYYLNCLRYALQRREPFEPIGDDGDLGKRFLAMSEAERTCVVMDMLCIYANYCVYETDEVDNNEEGVGPYVKKKRELIESFDAVEPRDGGDCEDFAKQMVRQAIELKVNGAKTFVSSAMRLVIEILNRFIFASVLCGVSKGSISFKDLGTAKLSGHECAVAIPKYVFFKALSRSNPNHPLFKLYSEEEINRGKGAEIYVLEGTGNLFPEPRAESRTHEKLADILFDSFDKRATTNACRQFFYKPDADDNFYKELIVIMTPEFFLLKGYVDCEFLLCLKNPDGSGRIYRGVHFSSFLDIDKNTSVQLVETPLIPLKTFRAALRFDDDNFPPMALRPARASQEMLKIAQDLTTVNLKYLGKEPDDFYSFQIRFQEMTPERLAILIREIKGRNLRSICYVEPVKISHSTGEAVGGYCLIVFF